MADCKNAAEEIGSSGASINQCHRWFKLFIGLKPCVKIKHAYYTVLYRASFWSFTRALKNLWSWCVPSYHKLYILGDNTLCVGWRGCLPGISVFLARLCLSIYCTVVFSLCLPKQTPHASKLDATTEPLRGSYRTMSWWMELRWSISEAPTWIFENGIKQKNVSVIFTDKKLGNWNLYYVQGVVLSGA